MSYDPLMRWQREGGAVVAAIEGNHDRDRSLDHSRIVQLEGLRAVIWGIQDTWGRMLAYRD